jgi:hypothetical protein
VLSKARARWGLDAFQGFFAHVLDQCLTAGLVAGDVVHVDSSLVAAHADKGKVQVALRYVGQALYQRLDQAAGTAPSPTAAPFADPSVGAAVAPTPTSAVAQDAAPSPLPGTRVCPTDPEARLTRKYGRTVLGYKDHRAVDDAHGIITATITTDAARDDGSQLIPLIQAHETATAQKVRTAAADMAYGTAENYQALEQREITPCIPHQGRGQSRGKLSAVAFTYDRTKDQYVCPEGQTLRRMARTVQEGRRYRYRAAAQACADCPIRPLCTDSRSGRTVNRHVAQDVIDRADGAVAPALRKSLLRRRKIRAEGSFADAANHHGFKRARWRGRVGMTIQNLLIAAVQNLRKWLKVVRPVSFHPAQRGSAGPFSLAPIVVAGGRRKKPSSVAMGSSILGLPSDCLLGERVFGQQALAPWATFCRPSGAVC